MGKMYTLKPDESINDHVKESMSIIDRIVELSIGCMRDLANPREGTFVDMTYNELMRSLEHIRESIQMLDELCDELEDDKYETRHEYEEKVIQFFNRFMNSDLADEYKERSNQLEKELSRLKVQYDELQKECSNWKDLCKTWQEESAKDYEKSKRLEERCSALVIDRDSVVEYWTKHCEELLQKHRKELAAKDREIYEARLQRDKNSDSATYWKCKCHELEKAKMNNPCNFCGNCKYYSAPLTPEEAQYCKHDIVVTRDVGTCSNKWARPYIVDPDDASCPHFEPNQADRDKPDHPCCEACNRDDCDNCTLCPF